MFCRLQASLALLLSTEQLLAATTSSWDTSVFSKKAPSSFVSSERNSLACPANALWQELKHSKQGRIRRSAVQVPPNPVEWGYRHPVTVQIKKTNELWEIEAPEVKPLKRPQISLGVTILSPAFREQKTLWCYCALSVTTGTRGAIQESLSCEAQPARLKFKERVMWPKVRDTNFL